MYYTLFSKKNKSVERESNIQNALSYYFSHEESIRAVAKRLEFHPSTFHGRLNGQIKVNIRHHKHPYLPTIHIFHRPHLLPKTSKNTKKISKYAANGLDKVLH